MKNVLIVHGAYGTPKENWIPWLGGELQKAGYEVVAPQFPTPLEQNLENWNKVLEELDFDCNEETVLVGHSIGATFLLSVAERYQVQKTILVSGFIDRLGNPDFDDINQTFFEKEFDWETIKTNVGAITMFHGTDDPYVPMRASRRLGELLETNPIMIADGGHLNEQAGFTEFPMLLEKVLE